MADAFKDRLDEQLQLRQRQQAAEGQGRRHRGHQVPRLRRLQEGDGLAQAGRRGHPGHAAGVPLAAVHVRHREGHQRLHGEAGHGRRADVEEDVRAGRGVGEEEPEGRRRPDVPALRGPRRDVQADQGRRRSATSPCCAPTAWPGRPGTCRCAKKPKGMNELEYQIRQFHGFLWAQRRGVQRLPDPQHRRVLLDEGRLAGQGQVGRRPALPRGLRRSELRHATRPSSRSPTAPSCSWKGGPSPGCHQEFASYCHGTKGSGVISESGHWPSHARLFKSQKHDREGHASGSSARTRTTPTRSSGNT